MTTREPNLWAARGSTIQFHLMEPALGGGRIPGALWAAALDATAQKLTRSHRSLRNGRAVYAMKDRISPEQGLGKDLQRSYFLLNAAMFLWELTEFQFYATLWRLLQRRTSSQCVKYTNRSNQTYGPGSSLASFSAPSRRRCTARSFGNTG